MVTKGIQCLQESKITRECVADDIEAIQSVLKQWCDELKLALVLTTGGTGLSARDVTPEATKALLHKEAPGLAVAMTLSSLKVTPMAMLSRSVCGVRHQTLVINLPGSKKASQECLECILPALPHALDLLSGNMQQVKAVHSQLSGCVHHQQHGTDSAGGAGSAGLVPVAARARVSPYPMISVKEAHAIIQQYAVPKEAISTSKLQDCLGYVVAEDVFAAVPLPPFPASVKDGYAVIAADGPGERKVLPPVTAGETPSAVVRSGYVSRITTGAPLPPGADAVVQVEDTQLVKATKDGSEEEAVSILASVSAGHDVRSVGVDIAKGQLVLHQGSRLGPSEVGLLSAAGVRELRVVGLPTVAVLSTGNEIVDPTCDLKDGQVFDSNRATLLAALKEQGFPTVDMGIARDSWDCLKESLSRALDLADVIITSGGVSMGEMDLLKPVLKKHFDAHIHFGRVFMKPGKPTTFATVKRNSNTKLVFALPGNPVSATVTFYLFALPVLRKMAGWKDFQLRHISVKLSSSMALDPRPEYHRASVSWSADSPLPLATSTGSQCSSRLLSMRTANALLVLPPKKEDHTHLAAGSVVQAIIIPHSL